MRIAGNTVMLAGAVIYVIALAALHYTGDVTIWAYTTREPAILTGIAVLVAIFALVGLFSGAIFFPAVAVSLSFLLLGQSVYFGEYSYSSFGVAYWACGAAALIMSVGGALIFGGYTTRGGPVAAYSEPSPGWYADPAGETRQRYWSGAEWTDQTRA